MADERADTTAQDAAQADHRDAQLPPRDPGPPDPGHWVQVLILLVLAALLFGSG